MSGLLRAFILFVCAFSEIHFASANTDATDQTSRPGSGIQLPEGCVKQKLYPCAVKTTNSKWKIQFGDMKVILSGESMFVWNSPGSFQIIKGEVWLESLGSESEASLKTEFGHLSATDGFNVFVKKSAEALEIYPLSGGVYVHPLGSKRIQGWLLPVGYRSTLSAVTEAGEAHYEIPAAANLKGLIETWAPLFDGTPQQLSQKLAEYRSHWVSAIEAGSLLHGEMAEREIANEKSRQARLAQLRQQRLKEQRHLKELYRQKNYLDE